MRVSPLAAVCSPRRALPAEASAQPAVEQFYKGKSIDMIIGYPPAGSNDIYARALARHIGKHIPGRPNVVPKNMPGAGSFLAVNNVYAVAPKDGTVLAIGAPTTRARRGARHRQMCASRPPSSAGSGASTR